MVNCKICSRKESRKRVIDDTKICCECTKKLKINNYELVNKSRNISQSSPKSNTSDHNTTIQSELNDVNNISVNTIKNLITECMKEVNVRNNKLFCVLSNHIKKLENYIGDKDSEINDLIDSIKGDKYEMSSHT